MLKACFGAVEPVDLGDATQLELMAYWIFERFSVEDSAAPGPGGERASDDGAVGAEDAFATEVR